MSALTEPWFVFNVGQKWEVKRAECSWLYVLIDISHLICVCVCLRVSCSHGISHPFQCQCLADCANLLEMAPAVRFSGKNSKRMECAANKAGLAPPPSELLCLGQSFYACLRRTQFAVIDSAPLAHTRDLNSGQDFRNCQPSILNSPTPQGKICLHILVMGVQLN